MFYYLYEIRNNINGKVYVGVHKTKVLDDGYMGSGKVINASIKKNGIDNFTKTILEHFASAEEMYAREKEVVNEEFLDRDDTYNLRRGGNGGFDYINKEGKNVDFVQQRIRDSSLSLRAAKGGNAGKQYHRENVPMWHATELWRLNNMSKSGKESLEKLKTDPEWVASFAAKLSSPEVYAKRKETIRQNSSFSGEKNSSFGSKWIYHLDFGPKKIHGSLLVDYIDQGWYLGQTLKYCK